MRLRTLVVPLFFPCSASRATHCAQSVTGKAWQASGAATAMQVDIVVRSNASFELLTFALADRSAFRLTKWWSADLHALDGTLADVESGDTVRSATSATFEEFERGGGATHRGGGATTVGLILETDDKSLCGTGPTSHCPPSSFTISCDEPGMPDEDVLDADSKACEMRRWPLAGHPLP